MVKINPDEALVSKCCTDIYSHPLILKLLDGMLHPGGLALSALMAEKMGVGTEDVILDIACGEGTTAIFLSRKFGCAVNGIDASPLMIEKANAKLTSLTNVDYVGFKQAFASTIPYESETFTGAYSECSLCTFPDKEIAVKEIHRVLKDNGIFGLNDVTIEDRTLLDEKLQNLIGRALCVADAFSKEQYQELLEKEGFIMLEIEDYTSLLVDLVNRAARNADILQATGKPEAKNILSEAQAIISRIQEQIDNGNIGYHLFIFRKP